MSADSTTATEPDAPRVLVTGAGGTVGAEIVELLLEAGWRVRATALARTPVPAQGKPGVEVLRGDLTDEAFCRELPTGCTAVIHTAAIIDITLDWDALAPLNLDAVRWLYEASREAGCDRFLHFSSASIYAPSEAPHVESDATRPTSPYEETKLRAEQWLETQSDGPDVTVIRPSMIFGPRNKDLAAILPSLPVLSRHFLGIKIGLRGGPVTNWVHGRDVARAAVFLLKRDDTRGEIYNVGDDSRKPFGAMLDDVYAAYGLRPTFRIPLLRIMRPLLKWFFTNTTVLRVLNRLIGGGWNKVVERYGLEPGLRPKVFPDIGLYATSNWIFDSGRLKGLGFEFEFPDCHEGWADTVRWYTEHEWVPAFAEGRPVGHHPAGDRVKAAG